MHQWLGKILLSLGSLVLFCLLAEGMVRLVPFHKENHGLPADDVVAPDRQLIWRLKPYQTGPFATNELGLRDTPFNRHAKHKILLLGDSVSWGEGIEDIKLTYAWLLEHQLGKNLSRSVEVINSAVPGYSTFQEQRYLQREGLQLEPDLIIVQFCLNDVVERYTRLAEYGGDNIFIGIDTRQGIRGLHGWLFRNSRAYETAIRMAVRLARNQQEYQVEKLVKVPLSQELTEAWELTLAELDQIRALATGSGVPMLLLAIPYRFQLERPEQTNQPQQLLHQWARSRGVPMVDLLPQFVAYRARHDQVPMFFDANHLTIEGHQLTADILAETLQETIFRQARDSTR